MSVATFDNTIFDDLILDNNAQLSVDVNNDKTENSVIKVSDDTKNRVAMINAENEKLRAEKLKDKKVVEPDNYLMRDFPQDVKTESRHEVEKQEMLDRRVVNMDGDYMKELEKDLKQRRSALASIELIDGTRLAEIRKQLKSNNVEESIAIKNAREDYQKTLNRYKDAKITELRGKGLSGDMLEKELSELIKQFGYIELLEMNNAGREAKAELNLGGNPLQKCWGYLEKTANAYNNLPMWKKLIFAGAGVAGGAFLATGGAATAGMAGTVSLAVGAKRLFGSAMAAAGTAKGLDTLHQREIQKDVNADVEKVMAKINEVNFPGTAEENANERYEFMRAILDTKLESVDKNLKKHELVSLCNKFIGVSVGFFLGSGMASKAFGGAINGIVEHFQHADAVTTEGVLGGGLKTPLTDSMNNPNGAPSNFVEKLMPPTDTAEALQVQGVTEDLTIKEGSNFSKTLLKELNDPNSDVYKYHPELKNANHQDIINRVLMDFKATHPEMGGHNPDYVLANSKIHFNPASLHAEMDDGQYGYYENIESGDTDSSSLNSDVEQGGVDGSLDHQEPVKVEVVDNLTQADLNGSEALLSAEDQVVNNTAIRDEALSKMNGSSGQRVTEAVRDKLNDVKFDANNAVEVAKNNIAILTAENVPVSNPDMLKNMIDAGASKKQILQTCLNKFTDDSVGSRAAEWNAIKDMPVNDVMSNPRRLANVQKMFEYFKPILENDVESGRGALPKINSNGVSETTKQWLTRVISLATKNK